MGDFHAARDFPQRQPRLKLLGPGSKILDSPMSEPPTGRFGNCFVIRASGPLAAEPRVLAFRFAVSLDRA